MRRRNIIVPGGQADYLRRVHILALGQSNLANHGNGPLMAARGCWAWHEGRAVPLADPVAGGTGTGESVWPIVARGLLARGEREVVVSLRAVGGAPSVDWAAGGVHYDALVAAAPTIDACPEPLTRIVWHQGESDTLANTTVDDYAARVGSLIEKTASLWPDARVVLCRASRVHGESSADVIAAQNRLIAQYGCIAGPDTDTLDDTFRYDRTHLNARGITTFATMLTDALLKPPVSPAT